MATVLAMLGWHRQTRYRGIVPPIALVGMLTVPHSGPIGLGVDR